MGNSERNKRSGVRSVGKTGGGSVFETGEQRDKKESAKLITAKPR